MQLVPKNWESFQHYKDRAPPWIKLHKALLDDRVFQRLPVASRALAPMLWLLASESKDGVFDGSVEELSFRLRQTEQEITDALKPLISNGFFSVVHGDSNALAECKQLAVPETEREAEKEKKPVRAASTLRPADVPENVWDAFLAVRRAKKAPITQIALDGIAREAAKASLSMADALQACVEFNWQGFDADWYAKRKPNACAATNHGTFV